MDYQRSRPQRNHDFVTVGILSSKGENSGSKHGQKPLFLPETSPKRPETDQRSEYLQKPSNSAVE